MKDEQIEELINSVDLNMSAPEKEPDRQYYFIKKAREYVRRQSETAGRKLTACSVCFGCQMNARDSEKLIGVLKTVGYEESDSEDADFVIFNTCTVRDNADQKLYGRLGLAGGIKKKKSWMKIAVCGCMMQEQAAVEKLTGSYRFVDLIFGTYNLYRFPELLCTMFESNRTVIDIWQKAGELVENLPVERKYPFKSGVNITFGCDNFCSYCIVPYVRGRERSRRPEDIIRECEKLSLDGVKEVMLLGQNVNSYGKGLSADEFMPFPQLLRRICRIDGIERIRFMTPHPKDFSDELINTIADEPKVAKHIHLPLQSGSDRILSRMNRHYTKKDYLTLAQKIRSRIPEAAITTDIIIGFPGEEDCDVDETIDVVEKVKFDNAFTFIYSKRTGTAAAAMTDQVSAEDVKRNFNRLLESVHRTSNEQTYRLIGMTQTVLVESTDEHDKALLTGRMSNNTIVHFPGDSSLIGSFVDVSLKECRGFYYMGSII